MLSSSSWYPVTGHIGNGSKLHQTRFRLDIRNIYFLRGQLNTGTGFLERWSKPHLSVFKKHLDNALNKALTGQAVGLDDSCRSLLNELFYSMLLSILCMYGRTFG